MTSEEEFDSWLRDTWRSHQNTDEKPEQTQTGNTNDAMYLYVYIYVEGESSEPLTLQVQKREYNFKELKEILSEFIFVDDSWRYFFLVWCNELRSKIKDELV